MLVLLSDKIDWHHFEEEFPIYYSHTGKLATPIRLTVDGLMLKRIYNLGDETLVEAWKMNPYIQYFCGMVHFEHKFACNHSDLVLLNGKWALESQILSDTTVAENNTTFPTDAKLATRIIE